MASKQTKSTRRTVLIAGAANIIVGVAKLAAGLLTGSSAMLAEAAHSAADTLNQGFLLTSLRQAERPADDRHPFGYERLPQTPHVFVDPTQTPAGSPSAAERASGHP